MVRPSVRKDVVRGIQRIRETCAVFPQKIDWVGGGVGVITFERGAGLTSRAKFLGGVGVNLF